MAKPEEKLWTQCSVRLSLISECVYLPHKVLSHAQWQTLYEHTETWQDTDHIYAEVVELHKLNKYKYFHPSVILITFPLKGKSSAGAYTVVIW